MSSLRLSTADYDIMFAKLSSGVGIEKEIRRGAAF
jgi:hypothetical protein